MNELVLFAGAGGAILGSRLLGHRVVGAVEIDPYCREILLRRQEEGYLEPFPVWDDIRTFDGRAWRGAVDIVSAGFPCQPFSAAGRRRGKDDSRNLWPETIRVIREVEPELALLENVPNLLAHDYFAEILGDLAEAGLDAEWGTLSAAAVGAPHLRERLWIVADAVSKGLEKLVLEPDGEKLTAVERGCSQRRTWPAEPDVGRMAHGLANRVDRLRAIGNGQVPRVVREAFVRLTS